MFIRADVKLPNFAVFLCRVDQWWHRKYFVLNELCVKCAYFLRRLCSSGELNA